MKVVLYTNSDKPKAELAAQELRRLAGEIGLELVSSNAEVVVALGGDGTILRAVRDFPEVPIFGLNLGGLGYLSCVGYDDARRALKDLAAGHWRVSERTRLSARKLGDNESFAEALNDIVIVREMTGQAALVDLTVDGYLAASYLADGLVVATPTGSTAYSLSAGGPVLTPNCGCFVVTPMNPHALGVRPLVIGDSVKSAVSLKSRHRNATETMGVYADGVPAFHLGIGETVEIARSPKSAKLVELNGYDSFEVMARKLGWKGCNL